MLDGPALRRHSLAQEAAHPIFVLTYCNTLVDQGRTSSTLRSDRAKAGSPPPPQNIYMARHVQDPLCGRSRTPIVEGGQAHAVGAGLERAIVAGLILIVGAGPYAHSRADGSGARRRWCGRQMHLVELE